MEELDIDEEIKAIFEIVAIAGTDYLKAITRIHCAFRLARMSAADKAKFDKNTEISAEYIDELAEHIINLVEATNEEHEGMGQPH